ncbi:MAG: STAS domain-containing protein [Methyloprofundus sp.]|nr:STAS domain-containing protein [Methyloprofundus sp.]
MPTLTITQGAKNCFSLSGDLSFETISNKTINELKVHTSHSPSYIDLQALQKIDSAGVALLIEWIKFAHEHQQELLFDAIPPQLAALIKLSDLSDCDLFKTQDIEING